MLKLDGTKLKNARLDKALTQAEAAKLADVSEVTYIRAESGYVIHGSTARTICEALGLVVADVRIVEENEVA